MKDEKTEKMLRKMMPVKILFIVKFFCVENISFSFFNQIFFNNENWFKFFKSEKYIFVIM